jgi:hypothetical protein
MRITLLFALFSAGTLCAAERMTVSICNLGELPASTVVRAESEVDAVFSPMDIQIQWKGCNDDTSAGPAGKAWFIVRLRNDNPPETKGKSSLDDMGRAYVGETGHAYLADAYAKAIKQLAARHDADADALLGLVMVHELGHLLLGAGHVPDGIMRAVWKADELEALRQRRLQFNKVQRERILQELRTRAELQETASGAAK